ncbi:MAG: bifunctional phosphoribosyl-AMP cyclohydrolase/phosphoribosyl-ATP diphosphatase HisIE [Nitrospirae bacterium]|nr:MAG: bifunctional phosphoribosyl-AMP cyclohydrolase/phosphoribosyl-ATP diphosphatase HisIE [Nitrospirota bacterium]
MSWLDAIKFDDRGLVPAIAQDATTGEVLMLAYCNREALRLTQETGFAHYFSRSRQKLWKKGESSGHVQSVRTIAYDCDADTVLFQVDQQVAACHTGRRSCFFHRVEGEEAVEVGEPLFDPEAVYRGAPTTANILPALERVVAERRGADPKGSYVAALLERGPAGIGKKVAEEAVEFALALATEGEGGVVGEAADLLFHALVALASRGLSTEHVLAELVRRFGTSGHAERAARE